MVGPKKLFRDFTTSQVGKFMSFRFQTTDILKILCLVGWVLQYFLQILKHIVNQLALLEW